ncbi:MAG: CAP domain-containing protein [Candidatus Roizmanbacteria bacterium]|nr:MAG: CAP domain-containing protein [Candidatus Roizmanbacteria bacterium]
MAEIKKFKFHDLIIVFLIIVFTTLGYTIGKNEYKEKLTITEKNLQIAQAEVKKLQKQKIVIPPISLIAPISPTPQITSPLSPTQTSPISPTIRQINSNSIVITPTEPWGTAKQIDEKTWTMNIALDDRMASAQEVFEALNIYRQRHNKSTLTWDDRLAEFAQTRAKYFTGLGKLDSHAGFEEYTKDIENVKKLGFWSLGENSSYGYKMYGVHLIEWIFAGDEPHNNNQLNSTWSHVGIGIDSTQVDLIFGGNKM